MSPRAGLIIFGAVLGVAILAFLILDSLYSTDPSGPAGAGAPAGKSSTGGANHSGGMPAHAIHPSGQAVSAVQWEEIHKRIESATGKALPTGNPIPNTVQVVLKDTSVQDLDAWYQQALTQYGFRADPQLSTRIQLAAMKPKSEAEWETQKRLLSKFPFTIFLNPNGWEAHLFYAVSDAGANGIPQNGATWEASSTAEKITVTLTYRNVTHEDKQVRAANIEKAEKALRGSVDSQ